MPIRRETMILIDDGLVHWSIYVSLIMYHILISMIPGWPIQQGDNRHTFTGIGYFGGNVWHNGPCRQTAPVRHWEITWTNKEHRGYISVSESFPGMTKSWWNKFSLRRELFSTRRKYILIKMISYLDRIDDKRPYHGDNRTSSGIKNCLTVIHV